MRSTRRIETKKNLKKNNEKKILNINYFKNDFFFNYSSPRPLVRPRPLDSRVVRRLAVSYYARGLLCYPHYRTKLGSHLVEKEKSWLR